MDELKVANEIDKKLIEELASQAMLEVGSFIKKRKRILGRVDSFHKDFRKKQNAKRSWRNNKKTYLKGIKRFHKSTQGKRFHRNLGKFNRYRATSYDHGNYSNEDQTAILSLQTHLVIESGYMIPDFDEHLSFYNMFNYVMPVLRNISVKMAENKELDEEEIEILKDLCNCKEDVVESN